jgi:hypothetical protein
MRNGYVITSRHSAMIMTSTVSGVSMMFMLEVIPGDPDADSGRRRVGGQRLNEGSWERKNSRWLPFVPRWVAVRPAWVQLWVQSGANKSFDRLFPVVFDVPMFW